ncbi:MAG TPA: helix-turn-helix domain-containing protein [Casimicrobiaceae bacterium]|nr:helix-turn-helix domain-containing protein [Casimicrobiaceae bacterium]
MKGLPKAAGLSPAERILAAADRLFYLHGIRAVGVDAVAAEAGVSKRTLYNYYATKDDLIAAYLVARFNQVAPSDAPAREQLLGYFDHLERRFASADYRGCPYVNAVAELCDPKHPAAGIAQQFKEQRRQWMRALLERLGANDPEALATQLQLLVEGAVAANLVRGDPALARAARRAAEVLIDASVPRTARAGRAKTGMH